MTYHQPASGPLFTPTSSPLVPIPTPPIDTATSTTSFLDPAAVPKSKSKSKSKPQLILFVGYPGLGKTTIYNRHFKPAGYAHVNQDTLKTKGKCLGAVEECLKAGRDVVVGAFLPLFWVLDLIWKGGLKSSGGAR